MPDLKNKLTVPMVSLFPLFDWPLILVGSSGEELPYCVQAIMQLAKGERAALFVKLHWTADVHLSNILAAQDHIQKHAPKIRFIVMAASRTDERFFKDKGLDAICANHNAFLDERVMYPAPETAKKYDAIYVARIAPSKRHELAAKTARLALVSGDWNLKQSDVKAALETCAGVTYCNMAQGSEMRELTTSETRAKIQQAYVGLALSEAEGAMYASVEYLLCGLPVVTTKARGGRHVFFHSDYVALVEDNADAVAEGVARMKAKQLDPFMIRSRTIALMREHRLRMIAKLSEVTGRDLTPLADPNGWLPQFGHKLTRYIGVRRPNNDALAASSSISQPL
jgi:glycosyltransferase involved in cell wall biosynthesis